jgi:hypothetical protein
MVMLSRVVFQIHRHHLNLALSQESANTSGPYETSIVTSLRCATKLLSIASASYEVLASPTASDYPCSRAELLWQGMLVDRVPEFTHMVSEAAVREHGVTQYGRADERTASPARNLHDHHTLSA